MLKNLFFVWSVFLSITFSNILALNLHSGRNQIGVVGINRKKDIYDIIIIEYI